MRKNRRVGMKFKNCKLRGEWAEFSGYDFVVGQGERAVRVQVKSTIFREGTGYSCTMKDSKGPYKRNSFEFVAAYVIPEDVWFIIPEKKVRGLWSVGLYPKLETAKYREYQEAWDLLRGETPGSVERIQACVEEFSDRDGN